MTAYVIVDAKVSDPQGYEGYKLLSPGAIAAAGGEFVVRGGDPEVLEGTWRPNRVVVVKFASMVAAKAFYDSELYVAARAKRAGTTEFFNMVVVQGV
jgi:uncharacterized protein (DUF1330 family)